MNSQKIRLVTALVTVIMVPLLARGQEPKKGKLKIIVSPRQAYTFVDGKGIGPGDRSVSLSPGDHTLTVANYGFKEIKQQLTIEPKKATPVDVALQPDGSDVSGPWGRIQFEVGMWDAGDYAVLLNGTSPGYFVGHIDEFNNDHFSKQQLIVPPGHYDVEVTRYGKTGWSGTIDVEANKRVIVDVSNGHQKIKDWPQGAQLASLSRFAAGTASATVVVAPVNGMVSAAPADIKCGQSSLVAWTSRETVDNNMSGMSPVPPNGQATVSPKKTTMYTFSGAGPGGKFQESTKVNVDPTVNAQLSASPAEVRYRRIGDKVIEQNSTTLSWNASNADTTMLDSGSVDPNGSKSVQMVPTQTTEGPVDETVTYTLNANNGCGGAATETSSVRIIGSIEPIPAVSLKSIYFPTDYPPKNDTGVGLVASQQDQLKTLATTFTKYLEYDPSATLTIAGHTDQRGSASYNEALSERRVQAVKDFLVSQGVAEDKVTTTAHGEQQQLDTQTVAELQSSNPNPPPEAHIKDRNASWLAYNRRVDILLVPPNAESIRFYPNDAPDVNILWQTGKPAPHEVKADTNPN